ncbi:hypothetical protein RJ639_012298 [Escallonia herrerae]|uniref:FAR1 domain-containing protein n=1 Tax=Escallonia herrerae TaxID=1293975 RepID=A0AA88VPM8_9ASTE|nr:hypothetical protein RJ639_012298 [Escallonia herrerae]
MERLIMAGPSCGHDFIDIQQPSDDENLENFGELEDVEDGFSLSCQRRIVNNEFIFIEPSLNGISVEKLEPFTGMTFTSLDDARDFYYEYAKRTGFTIRTNRIRHSLKNTAIIGRDFVCSREGFRSAKHTLRKDRVLPPKPVTREGCKAMIRLAARDGGKWLVTKFVGEHNHKLMTSCGSSGELPIINILSEVTDNTSDGDDGYGGSMMTLILSVSPADMIAIASSSTMMEEKDKKIQDLFGELQQERERSAAFQRQLHAIIKDLEEHSEFMSVRVEDIVKNMKDISVLKRESKDNPDA